MYIAWILLPLSLDTINNASPLSSNSGSYFDATGRGDQSSNLEKLILSMRRQDGNVLFVRGQSLSSSSSNQTQAENSKDINPPAVSKDKLEISKQSLEEQNFEKEKEVTISPEQIIEISELEKLLKRIEELGIVDYIKNHPNLSEIKRLLKNNEPSEIIEYFEKQHAKEVFDEIETKLDQQESFKKNEKEQPENSSEEVKQKFPLRNAEERQPEEILEEVEMIENSEQQLPVKNQPLKATEEIEIENVEHQVQIKKPEENQPVEVSDVLELVKNIVKHEAIENNNNKVKVVSEAVKEKDRNSVDKTESTLTEENEEKEVEKQDLNVKTEQDEILDKQNASPPKSSEDPNKQETEISQDKMQDVQITTSQMSKDSADLQVPKQDSNNQIQSDDIKNNNPDNNPTISETDPVQIFNENVAPVEKKDDEKMRPQKAVTEFLKNLILEAASFQKAKPGGQDTNKSKEKLQGFLINLFKNSSINANEGVEDKPSEAVEEVSQDSIDESEGESKVSQDKEPVIEVEAPEESSVDNPSAEEISPNEGSSLNNLPGYVYSLSQLMSSGDALYSADEETPFVDVEPSSETSEIQEITIKIPVTKIVSENKNLPGKDESITLPVSSEETGLPTTDSHPNKNIENTDIETVNLKTGVKPLENASKINSEDNPSGKPQTESITDKESKDSDEEPIKLNNSTSTLDNEQKDGTVPSTSNGDQIESTQEVINSTNIEESAIVTADEDKKEVATVIGVVQPPTMAEGTLASINKLLHTKGGAINDEVYLTLATGILFEELSQQLNKLGPFSITDENGNGYIFEGLGNIKITDLYVTEIPAMKRKIIKLQFTIGPVAIVPTVGVDQTSNDFTLEGRTEIRIRDKDGQYFVYVNNFSLEEAEISKFNQEIVSTRFAAVNNLVRSFNAMQFQSKVENELKILLKKPDFYNVFASYPH